LEARICACGCGRPIPPNLRHRYRPPTYLKGHVSPAAKAARLRAAQAGKQSKRLRPPPGWRVPSGVCECGCGQPTDTAPITRRERDQYAGFPMRYVSGHSVAGKARGPQKNSWKGGRYVHKTGYIYVYAPVHPHKNADGYVLEHRLIYERTHGVTLTRRDIVHHLNGQRADNRPENLHCTTRDAHSLMHQTLDIWREEHPEEAARAARTSGAKGAEVRWGEATGMGRPPPDWRPPSGLCGCGCGGATGIVKVTSRTKGRYAGYPARFLRGHANRVKKPPHAQTHLL
jgi:hypothetical protein